MPFFTEVVSGSISASQAGRWVLFNPASATRPPTVLVTADLVRSAPTWSRAGFVCLYNGIEGALVPSRSFDLPTFHDYSPQASLLIPTTGLLFDGQFWGVAVNLNSWTEGAAVSILTS